MWYKYNEETNEWYFGNEVRFPDKTSLKDNHRDTKDGWFWSDEIPREYLEYLENLENESI